MLPASSMLDRTRSVLVVVDTQDRLLAAIPDARSVTARTVFAIRVAALIRVPIVCTRQYPDGLGALEPSVAAAIDLASEWTNVTRVDKMTFDCFGEPAFADAVCSAERQQLALVGTETHICVAQTALAGLREGFDVHVLSDACASREEPYHESALARLRHAGAVVSTTESAAYELVGCAGTDEFRGLLAAVKAAAQMG